MSNTHVPCLNSYDGPFELKLSITKMPYACCDYINSMVNKIDLIANKVNSICTLFDLIIHGGKNQLNRS